MSLVRFGILAVSVVSLSLCAGCAMQAGDPDPADETPTEMPTETATGATTAAPATKGTTPGGGLHKPTAPSTTPVNFGSPDPSPWQPTQIPTHGNGGNGNGGNGSGSSSN